MDKLDEYRQNIDKIDKEMVRLFEERMKNADVYKRQAEGQ